MNWTLFDFLFFGALVAGAAFIIGLAMMRALSPFYRLGVVLAAAAAFLLVMVTGAVGIIGSEQNDANLWYAGALLIALAGAALARFRAAGLARAMVAAAAAIVLIGATAVSLGLGADSHAWPYDILGATGLFGVLFLASAWCFRRAARGAALSS